MRGRGVDIQSTSKRGLLVSSARGLLRRRTAVIAKLEQRRGCACGLGGDLLVDAEVLFDRGDADFELQTLVDLMLLELGQLRVEPIDFGSKVGLDVVDLGIEAGDVRFGGHGRLDVGNVFRERRELFVCRCGAFGYQLRKRFERCFL